MDTLAAVRTRLTFANITAALALAVALGTGGAYAAQLGKNTVGSKQVINSSLKGKDVKDDALTGADVNEGTLGTVPSAASAASAANAANAAALAGTGAASYGRSVAHVAGSFSTGNPIRVTVPGFGQVGYNCRAGGTMEIAASLSAPAGSLDILRASFSNGPGGAVTTRLYNPGPANENYTTVDADLHVEMSYYFQSSGNAKAFMLYGYAYNDGSCKAVLEVQQLRG